MNHLTEDQLDDLLIGDAAADSRAHLDACPLCTARLNAVLTPVASFNAASLAWSQRRSATLPLQLRQTSTPTFAGGRMRLAIGTVAAAVFALVLALPFLHHGAAPGVTQQAVAVPPPAPGSTAVLASPTLPTAGVETSQAPDSETPDPQIVRDNQLLQAIDRELATSETPADLMKMVGQQDSNQSSPDVTHND